MAVDFLLQTYVAHVSSVIVWLIVGCLGLIALYLLLSLREEKLQVEGSGQANFTQLEETLKKVLENTSGIGGREAAQKLVEVPGVVEATAAEGLAIAAELEAKNKRLKELEAELITAKASVDQASGAKSSDNSDLDAKIKSLEAKLAEYQVVEDDIANLSLYREENARLKDEIERLKAGGATALAEPPPAAADDNIAEFEQALREQDKVAQATPPLTPEDVASPVEDDLMAEFEAVVKNQKQQEIAASSNAEISRAVEAPIDQDVMGDFEASVKAGEPSPNVITIPTPAVVAAQSDAAKTSTQPQPAAAPVPLAVVPDLAVKKGDVSPEIVGAKVEAKKEEPKEKTPEALAAQLDTDQMADQMINEVNAFKPAEAPLSEDNEGDRLIAEFENFVKKEGDS